MNLKEYYDEFPNNMIVINGQYYQEFEDWIEDMDSNGKVIDYNNLPVIHGTDAKAIEIDADRIIDDLLENEDAYDIYDEYDDITNGDKIYEFVKEFNTKYADRSYFENDTVIELSEKELSYYRMQMELKHITELEYQKMYKKRK